MAIAVLIASSSRPPIFTVSGAKELPHLCYIYFQTMRASKFQSHYCSRCTHGVVLCCALLDLHLRLNKIASDMSRDG